MPREIGWDDQSDQAGAAVHRAVDLLITGDVAFDREVA